MSADAAPEDASGDVATIAYLPARSAPDDAPALPSKVEAVLFSLRPGFNLCYRTAARQRPDLQGAAMFFVTIGGDGRVVDVALTTPESTLGVDLLSCITTVIRTAAFEPTPDGGTAAITVPITFRPPARRPDAGP